MFWRRKRPLDDFDEEIRSHLELEADNLQHEGIDARESVYAARRTFGNVTALRERSYERSRWVWWDHFRRDLRYAFRTLYRSPVFTVTAILTLALGIGANTAIFSVVNAVLLKPLPYQDQQRIVVLEPFYTNTGDIGTVVSAPDFHDWRKQNTVFEYLAYHQGGEATVVANGIPSFAQVQRVTPDFFRVFGLAPEAGRFWIEQENRSPLAVVGHSWAQQQFGDVQQAIGASIKVGGIVADVIGVTAPGFRYPETSDIWIPAGLFPENPHRSGHNYYAIGKLKVGITLATAQQEMRTIADRLAQEYEENRFKTVVVTPLQEKLAKNAEATLWVLLGSVFAVLLIACANVASLHLARTASRTREMAVRAALGASRGRILRQVLTESALLGSVGAVAGVGLAEILLRVFLAMAPPDIARLDHAGIDGTVLLFAFTLAGGCSVLSGLAPARWSAKPQLVSELRQNSSRGSIGGITAGTRSVLVVAEIALSVVLLAGAGLLLRSFLALTQVELGFSTDQLLLTSTSIHVADENEARRATELQRDLLQRIRVLPGVRRAAGVRTIPFTDRRPTAWYRIEGGREYRPGEEPSAQTQVVTPGYFESLGVALVRGRDFTESDAWGRPQVAIINQTLARDAFGEEHPIGRRIRCGMSSQSVNGMEIIGVVGDARQVSPGESARPEIFMPYLQHPFPGSNLTLVVQTVLEPYALASAIRATVTDLNPEFPVRFSTVNETLFESLAYPRFRAVLVGCFAFLAACLAIVGVYGVISYLVGQRTGEIGLRLALGARPVDVFRFVIGGSMRLVLAGLALGLVGTLGVSWSVQSLLFEVSPQDPLTVLSVATAVTFAALFASSLPALRAARLDPLVALRED